ncbi:DUF3632 domain-containing protein [Aspergillus glaucus CBS 516.65]|uniref:Uncharacterized protein n=1 Tax=Aspergillus glaucus CBS 516.65 TaxID=1160497 RepID=A0A1L9VP22_ASPGL|nr:hypothetical protein ASPGLDRAFT_65598 [Aspergillus glaucus CBS 516.65]OJJ85631.1 hypothetical protein ASPGLDRAFT_65598 [Aspergillus glaucus CBS 516.65]
MTPILLDNALDQIVDLTLAAHMAPNKEEYFTLGNVDYYLSLALMEHVQNLEPSKQKRLVEFICGLQKRTATDPSTGEPLRNAFVAQFTQATNISYDPPPPDQGPSIHRLDRSLRAIITLRSGLENDKVPMETLCKTASMEVACVWFMYAADRLWDNVRYGRTYSGDLVMRPGCKRFKKRKWKGYERGRWDAWVERLKGARAVCDDERMRGGLLGRLWGVLSGR